MPAPSRLFAVIPAAGRSRRMGQPKLLLPIDGETVISRLLRTLRRREIVAIAVVLRADDAPLRSEIAANGGTPLQPESAPPEMRDSIEHALRWIEAEFQPTADDAWLLTPGDHPLLESEVLDRLLERWSVSAAPILIPTCRGKRGHPIVLRWSLVPEVFALPRDAGLNQLVRQHANEVVELEVARESVIADLDTPEDYERALRESGKRRAESGNVEGGNVE